MEVNKDGVDSVRLVELYYWLGESYLRLKKLSIAKEYLNKAMRGYKFHDLQDT
jgi:TolA-binding protein